MVVTLSQQYNVGERPTVILYTYINRHRPPNATKAKYNTIQYIIKNIVLNSSNIQCSVDLKPGDCELVVDEGRALQPCRYRWCTHMSCIIIYPYSTYPCRGYFHIQ